MRESQSTEKEFKKNLTKGLTSSTLHVILKVQKIKEMEKMNSLKKLEVMLFGDSESSQAYVVGGTIFLCMLYVKFF